MRRAFLKRVFIAFLFASFLGGTSTQAMSVAMSPDKPCGMAMDVSKSGSDTGNPQSRPSTLPACIALVGCAIFVGTVAPDLSTSTPLRWSSAWYGGDLTSLVGRSIKPDLFPPIFA